MPRQQWTAAAVPSEVRRLRHEVQAFACTHGVRGARAEDVALAVTEIVTNAVMHAHRDGTRVGVVRVAADVDEGHLRVRVDDDGMGLSPRDDSPGAGLGMCICDQLAEVQYGISDDGGTRVEMRFAVAA